LLLMHPAQPVGPHGAAEVGTQVGGVCDGQCQRLSEKQTRRQRGRLRSTHHERSVTAQAVAQYSIASINGEGSSSSAQKRSRIFTVSRPGSPFPIGSPSSELIGVTPPAVVTAISSSAS